MRAVGRICCNPEVMLGQPTIRGTRLTVAFILRCLATMDIEEVLEQYPFLTREDVAAALEYAAEVLEGGKGDNEFLLNENVSKQVAKA
ncbi:Uncharacterized conserved protein, DUF433 family [Thermanaeromonas toyohensis ToBE]|uniref:Uncharacterized conserved protein, DUF433 family n=1 Tax=Thermanaeromonas toyohensis ToBE TaxID=698762 RepID=A0A1W1VTQ3_9FIRM|nr:DUF433 domain-containing protein [Thermanaeromonas toyohensis]SMB96706.1 Uncharacterized conserved protein, DUF433 family [Thermanaeromonas toyohensis ToBE]